MKLVDFSFKADDTKNGEVTRIALLKVEINGHKKQINAAVTDLNGTDMFLGHNWLVKHNAELNWKEGQNTVYKMSKIMQNKASRHQVQNQKNTSNGHTRQWKTGNRQGTRSNEPRKPSRVYLTFYTLVQQKEVQKTTRTTRIGSQNQPNGRHT